MRQMMKLYSKNNCGLGPPVIETYGAASQLTTVNKTPTILSISFDSAGYLTCIGSLQTHIYKPDV